MVDVLVPYVILYLSVSCVIPLTLTKKHTSCTTLERGILQYYMHCTMLYTCYTNGVGSDTNNEDSVSSNALKYSYRAYQRISVNTFFVAVFHFLLPLFYLNVCVNTSIHIHTYTTYLLCYIPIGILYTVFCSEYSNYFAAVMLKQ